MKKWKIDQNEDDSFTDIVAAQSSLDWGDKVIGLNHPPTPPQTLN